MEKQEFSLISDDVCISIQEWVKKPILQQTSDFAQVTAPDFSPVFIILFILASYFHESYPLHFSILACVWLSLQLYNYIVMDPDFRHEIVNRIFTMIVYILVYLVCGIAWSFCKLYIDVWQGQLNDVVMISILKCYDTKGANSCALNILDHLKWDLTRSITAFPISMVYTLSRDPLNLFNGFLYNLLFDTYTSILMSAAQAYDSSKSVKETAQPPINLTRLCMYLVLYPLIGYVWSHIKLYLDVWRGHIPKQMQDKNPRTFLHRIRNLLLQWIIFWPISVVHTLLRDPVALICDFLLHISRRTFIFIIERASFRSEKVD